MSSYITLKINNTEIKARAGANLLWTAIDNGFYIPNLCSIRGETTSMASCRLCFVEIKDIKYPVTSCTQKVYDGMEVLLDTPKVNRLRRTAFELLLSNHYLDCKNCKKNGNCELQNIAGKLKLPLKFKRFKQIDCLSPIDISHPLFIHDPNKCVLCGKCVYICYKNGMGILNFSKRGINTKVSTFYETSLAESGCNDCLECVEICPVASLVMK
jgi:formate dehydrogenase major subunit/NADH-quinone oxidoreductase subunit G